MKSSTVSRLFSLVRTQLRSRCGLGFLMALSFLSCAWAQPLPAECGSLVPRDGWGPFDYRPEKYVKETTYGSHAARLAIVEGAHFTPQVESLIRGMTAAAPGGDISYTLARFPNNHRALVAMARLAELRKNDKPDTSPYTIDCWFKRALLFAPDDNVARLLYADHLIKKSRLPEAEQHLSYVAENAGDSPFTHNNIGLLYFDLQKFDRSLYHAQRAFELGLVNSATRAKLEQTGKWLTPNPEESQRSATTPSRP